MTVTKKAEGKSVRAVVAAGCVVTGHDAPHGREVKPGDPVTLFDYEAELLTDRGFLVGKEGLARVARAPKTRNEEGGE